jgi:hypothetical protein
MPLTLIIICSFGHAAVSAGKQTQQLTVGAENLILDAETDLGLFRQLRYLSEQLEQWLISLLREP